MRRCVFYPRATSPTISTVHIALLHSINPPDPYSPLIGQNLIAVSSHYMENSMPYLACLPVGGASLANDDVMRGGGAAEIGMWRKQVRWSVAVVVTTDSVIHSHKRPSLDHTRNCQPSPNQLSNFNFLRGHHLPPIDYARPRRQQSPISTIHLALLHRPVTDLVHMWAII